MKKSPGPRELELMGVLERFRSEANADHSEIALLGSCLVYDEGMVESVALLQPSDFWSPTHRTVFDAVVELVKTGGVAADPRAVATILSGKGRSSVGFGMLSDFIRSACIPSMVPWHARQIRNMARWRECIEQIARCKDQYQTPDELIDALVSSRRQADNEAKAEPLGRLAVERVEYVERMLREGHNLTGIPTGINLLDYKTGGLQPGTYSIIGGRPKMGKTALLLELAIRVASQGYPVLFVSQEMGKTALIDRLTAACASVPANAIRTGNVNLSIIDRLRDSALSFGQLDFQIVDKRGLRVRDVFRLARDLPKRGAVVVIDYIQLMTPDDKKQPREQQVSSISRQIQASALETELPWIVAAQLKRLSEGGNNPRPVLSDLRESGSLEQDADLIAFVHREDYGKEPVGSSPLELIVAGNRHGSTGTIPLTFYRDIQRIVEAF